MTKYVDPPPAPPASTGLLGRNVGELLAWNWEKTLYALLILAAFVTRFYDLGTRVMSHDESLHTEYAWYLYQGRGYTHSPMMHGPLKFELTAFTYWLLGDNDFTSRIPSALMGVAAVGLMYFFRKWLGRAGALAASLLTLISPYMLYYSRYIRDEPYVVVWGLLTTLCVIQYMESRAPKYLYGLAAVTALFYATMESSFIYIAISMLFLGLHVVRELFAVQWPRAEYRRPFELAFAVTLAALCVAGALLVYSQKGGALSGTETAVPAVPGQAVAGAAGAASPLISMAFVAGLVAAAGLLTGAYLVFRSFGEELRRFPVLDLLIVFGLFALPQLAAFPVRALGHNPIDYTLPATQGVPFPDSLFIFLGSNMGVTAVWTVVLLAASAVLGVLWDWRRFLICAGIFYGIYIPTFTTFFTNGGGIATGLVGSLGYWLEQQGVRRGGQPWYYYPLIHLPMYEFLPTAGTLLAAGLGLTRWFKAERDPRRTKTPISPSDTLGFPVLGYLGFWAAMAPLAFSIAGEKMPWLTTHIALPFILVGGWAIGWVIEGVDWQAFREPRAWLMTVLALVSIVALGGALGMALGANPPFQGQTLAQSQATLTFLSAALVAVAGGAGVVWLARQKTGWGQVGRLAGLCVFGVMGLFTVRAAFTAAYINYDDANEFLVYAHGARGVKTVMNRIEDLSLKMTDGLNLKVAYDSPVAWPMTWYFRNYPNQAFYGDKATREGIGDAPVVVAGSQNWGEVEKILGNRYAMFEYIRMVWPMQDYFGSETWRNVREGLPLAPASCRTRATYASIEDRLKDEERIRESCRPVVGGIWTNKDYRQALWNIWFARDYTLYGQLTNQNFDLSQWPVVDRMRMYVRKDLAALVWDYRVDTTVAAEPAPTTIAYDQYRQLIAADAVWGAQGGEPGQFAGPRSVAVAPDGAVFVADSRNNRIQKFDGGGRLILTWGTFGAAADGQAPPPGTFNEPWGVAVGPDGSVYVADTWNHRIQKFDTNGAFISTWGREGQGEAFDALWGPRGVVVDRTGRVFVSDTGNKRVVVYDADGNGLTSIGVTGAGAVDPGFLDEPVGIAVAADGTVYVADTWNMRIQAFKLDTAGDYVFTAQWPIDGWYGQSLDNKPYLAVDKQGRLYATDPESFRVLVFDKSGKFLTTWGEGGVGQAQFGVVSGVAVNSEGQVYVADSGNNRIMRFPPLP